MATAYAGQLDLHANEDKWQFSKSLMEFLNKKAFLNKAGILHEL